MEKFIPKKKRPEKEMVSIRLDKDLLEKIDQLSSQNDISRNEFIAQAINFAIHHMDEEKEEA